jgi:hypothetical protein
MEKLIKIIIANKKTLSALVTSLISVSIAIWGAIKAFELEGALLLVPIASGILIEICVLIGINGKGFETFIQYNNRISTYFKRK